MPNDRNTFEHAPNPGLEPGDDQLIISPLQFDSVALQPPLCHWELEGGQMFHILQPLDHSDPFSFDIAANRVVMVFVQKGAISLQQASATAPIELQNLTHHAIYSASASTLKAEIGEIEVFGIVWQAETYLRWAALAAAKESEFTQQIKNGEDAQLAKEPMFLDLAMQACIRQVVTIPPDDSSQQLLLQAKGLELIALQLLSVHRRTPSPTRLIKSDYDRERIVFARDYLIQAMAAPPSLQQLARIAGINEFKLKRGFKELFGNTVFGYLAQARLEIAKTELLEGRKSTTEIAFDLGYASLQHFSTAFKKHFGVSPNRLTK